MKASDYHIGFIGFGHMASIIFEAIDHARMIPRSQISFVQRDRDRMKKNEMRYKITSTSLKNLIHTSDVLILGVRPNQAKQVLEEIRKEAPSKSKKMISMLAGLKLDFYEKYWEGELLRIMPNVGASVFEGMTTLSFKPGATVEFQDFARMLLSSMGKVLTLQESLMDIACALSGSGPGFVFRLIEAFSKTGEKHGLTAKEALLLASQTFLGAAKLASKENLEILLTQITTPNGTTEAGLNQMSALGIGKALEEVIEASMKRSIELSKEF